VADDPDGRGTPEERFRHAVGGKAERRRRARAEPDGGVWHWLGMFGLVGWAVAIPTLLGIAAGVWLDRHYGDGISWTLSLLFIGVVVGCLHAWYWISQERRGR
jgi:ATP synthase protein I